MIFYLKNYDLKQKLGTEKAPCKKNYWVGYSENLFNLYSSTELSPKALS